MNNKINLSDLVSSVAEQTNTDPLVVERFLKQFFNEIESALLTDSFIKIENFGIFKIFKGGGDASTNRILFLPAFKQQPLSEIKKLEVSVPEDSEIAELQKEETIFEKSLVPRDLNDTSLSDVSPKITESSDFDDTVGIINPCAKENLVKQTLDSDALINNAETLKRKSNLKFISIVTGAIIIIIVLLYYFFSLQTDADKNAAVVGEFTQSFKEIASNDSNYSCQIEVLNESNIMRISLRYLGAEVFWGYIFDVNEDVIDDPLNIKKGTVLNIPKLDPALINKNDPISVEKAKDLASTILTNKQKIKANKNFKEN